MKRLEKVDNVIFTNHKVEKITNKMVGYGLMVAAVGLLTQTIKSRGFHTNDDNSKKVMTDLYNQFADQATNKKK